MLQQIKAPTPTIKKRKKTRVTIFNLFVNCCRCAPKSTISRSGSSWLFFLCQPSCSSSRMEHTHIAGRYCKRKIKIVSTRLGVWTVWRIIMCGLRCGRWQWVRMMNVNFNCAKCLGQRKCKNTHGNSSVNQWKSEKEKKTEKEIPNDTQTSAVFENHFHDERF